MVLKFVLKTLTPLCITVLIGIGHVFGQTDTELADVYFQKGECEKSNGLYEKVLKKDFNKVYLRRYVQCVQKTKDMEAAEKFLKKMTKSDERFGAYYTLYWGRTLEQANKPELAQVKYEEALAALKTDLNQYKEFSDDLKSFGNLDLAIAALLKARNVSREPSIFKFELAQLYGLKGASEAMIEELLSLGLSYQNRDVIQNYLQDYLKDEKEQVIFEKVLYEKIQHQPNENFYAEMLIWFFTQKKQFNKAFIQERALDRRLKQGGIRVYDLATLASQNKDYKTAIQAFEYVSKEYPEGQMYSFARRMAINAREEEVKNTFPIEKASVETLIGEYDKMFSELGQTPRTMEAMRSVANLFAFYLDNKDTATVILQKAITVGQNDNDFRDKCKLDLGDIYLLKNEPWEATLLYSQVEKAQKESVLGYESKLRNARLNYYKGDFTLAKEILDILKNATTREIANDAGSLSLLIQDNTGTDTSEDAMREYAAIDLLLYQNQIQEALSQLDKMYVKYKAHPLEDEIQWLKARTYLKIGETEKAIQSLDIIVQKFSYDILADDALFTLADIYENRLNDKSKAMEYYQMILEKYPASIYGADARKKYRGLRGDSL